MKLMNFLALLIIMSMSNCGSSPSQDYSSENEDATTNLSGVGQEKLSPYRKEKHSLSKTKIEIAYSAPSVKGRDLWGELVPYDLVWRTGADEASTIEVGTEITLLDNEGQEFTLPKGKYAIFTIPSKEAWTIIFNTEYDQWGAFNYNEEKDQIRLSTKPIEVEDHVEQLKFSILETDSDRGEIKLAWGNLQVPIGFSVP